LFRVVRWLTYSHDQINTTGYGYRAKLSLVKIEHPIVTGKGGRMLFVSDDVMGLHEAYKSN
jgi:pimeloyl-CoA synthetase